MYTSIAVSVKHANDSHVIRHVTCHTDHSLQCWSDVFFFQLYQNVCLLLSICHYIHIFHWHFTR